jgi:Glycosyltransferase family 87
MAAIDTCNERLARPQNGVADGLLGLDVGHISTAQNRAASKWRVAILCMPLLLVFSWIMLQRLAACPKDIQADFVQEWTSARNYWTEQPIYWPLSQSLPHYFGPQAQTWLLANAHPPVSVLVAIPFGLLDYRTAWAIWNIASLLLLAISPWLLMRKKGLSYNAADAVAVVTLLLASNTLAQQVVEGQVNLVLLALLVGAWAADRRDRQFAAGALVGLAAAVKLFPALVLVYFLGSRRWRAVAAFGISFASVSLLAAGLLGVDIFRIYVQDVMPAFAQYTNNAANASLPGFFNTVFLGTHRLSAPLINWPAAPRVATLASGLVVAALCGWKSYYARNVVGRDIAFASCTIGMMLASPITWGHSFVLLALPLLLLWRRNSIPMVRYALGAMIGILWLIRPNWFWNLIPGVEELALGVAQSDFHVSPLLVLTLGSLYTHALLGMFVISLTVIPAARRREPTTT